MSFRNEYSGEVASHTLLVVEDDNLTRIDTSEHVRDCGFEVIEAEHAGAALALLMKSHPIDLVFTDVQMLGKMDGLDLAKWVLQHRPDVLVMIASGIWPGHGYERIVPGRRVYQTL